MWWRSRRWRGLLQLLDELPSTSRVKVAQVEDDELATQLVEAGLIPDESPPWAPPLREYDATAVLLQQVLDTLEGANYQRAQGKGGRPKPSPRPVTAVERARKRADQNVQASFLDYLLSNRQHTNNSEDGDHGG